MKEGRIPAGMAGHVHSSRERLCALDTKGWPVAEGIDIPRIFSELCDGFPLALTRFVELFDLVDIIEAAPHHSSLNFFPFFRNYSRNAPHSTRPMEFAHHRHTLSQTIEISHANEIRKWIFDYSVESGVECSRRNPVNGLNWTGGHLQLRPFQMRLSVSWRRVSHRLTGQTQVADSKILSKRFEARWRPKSRGKYFSKRLKWIVNAPKVIQSFIQFNCLISEILREFNPNLLDFLKNLIPI